MLTESTYNDHNHSAQAKEDADYKDGPNIGR